MYRNTTASRAAVLRYTAHRAAVYGILHCSIPYTYTAVVYFQSLLRIVLSGTGVLHIALHFFQLAVHVYTVQVLHVLRR